MLIDIYSDFPNLHYDIMSYDAYGHFAVYMMAPSSTKGKTLVCSAAVVSYKTVPTLNFACFKIQIIN